MEVFLRKWKSVPQLWQLHMQETQGLVLTVQRCLWYCLDTSFCPCRFLMILPLRRLPLFFSFVVLIYCLSFYSLLFDCSLVVLMCFLSLDSLRSAFCILLAWCHCYLSLFLFIFIFLIFHCFSFHFLLFLCFFLFLYFLSSVFCLSFLLFLYLPVFLISLFSVLFICFSILFFL